MAFARVVAEANVKTALPLTLTVAPESWVTPETSRVLVPSTVRLFP